MPKFRDRRRDNGQWFFVPTKDATIHGCCDCALLHRMKARVLRDGRVQIAMTRDDALTAEVRARFVTRRKQAAVPSTARIAPKR